jgi:hypothetical protein
MHTQCYTALAKKVHMLARAYHVDLPLVKEDLSELYDVWVVPAALRTAVDASRFEATFFSQLTGRHCFTYVKSKS